MSHHTIAFLDRKSDTEGLEPVLEVNEQHSVLFDRPTEVGDFEEISPRIFTLKDVKEPLTLPSLNNAIYELGVVNLSWPEISEPVFETRTCFPPSYYTNSTKERLLLAYAENFRRQYNFNYKFKRPLLFQAPNECGLQKMVCTTIRPTKICYPGTNTWQGVASLVSDFFDYEPLTKPMLLVEVAVEDKVASEPSCTTSTPSTSTHKRGSTTDTSNPLSCKQKKMVIPSSNSSTPRKRRLLNIIITKDSVIKKQKRKIRALQAQNRRLKNKVVKLEDILKELKEKFGL